MRTAEMYSKITERIAAVCNSVTGGVGVFLPSYAVLESIAGPLRAADRGRPSTAQPGRTLLVERPGLTNEESEEMMGAFKSSRGCVLLAVQGGRFSEGEDFPGDEMDVSRGRGSAASSPIAHDVTPSTDRWKPTGSTSTRLTWCSPCFLL